MFKVTFITTFKSSENVEILSVIITQLLTLWSWSSSIRLCVRIFLKLFIKYIKQITKIYQLFKLQENINFNSCLRFFYQLTYRCWFHNCLNCTGAIFQWNSHDSSTNRFFLDRNTVWSMELAKNHISYFKHTGWVTTNLNKIYIILERQQTVSPTLLI